MSDVLFIEETTSTNDEVKRAIEAGKPEGFAVCARRQTGGYGRQGRLWVSPEGGLYLSLLLRPQVPVSELPTLSLVVSLAVRRALCSLVSEEQAQAILVKWPNDLVVSRGKSNGENHAPSFQKLCGISVELYQGAVCVGMGVNVFKPAEAVSVGGKNAPVYLADMGFSGGINVAAEALVENLFPLYNTWQQSGFASLLEEYRHCSFLMGSRVCMVNHVNEVVAEGVVESVDEFGRLVLRNAAGACVPVVSGEAHLVFRN